MAEPPFSTAIAQTKLAAADLPEYAKRPDYADLEPFKTSRASSSAFPVNADKRKRIPCLVQLNGSTVGPLIVAFQFSPASDTIGSCVRRNLPYDTFRSFAQ